MSDELLRKRDTTTFGTGTEFSGKLEFSDNLVIAGKFEGTIQATGNLEIAATAVCSVDYISTETIVISGKVTGNIKAPGRIEMKNGSKILGDVVTSRLKIADNVDFHGQITMLDMQTPTPDIFSVPASEYKPMLNLSTAGTTANLPSS